MQLKDIVELLEPMDVVGVAGRGARGVFYIGQALNLPERKDLMELEVARIGRELIWGHNRLCIRVNARGGAA